MAVSTPRPPSITVYGVDAQVWADFRAFCISRRLNTGDQVELALRAHMAASPRPETIARDSQE